MHPATYTIRGTLRGPIYWPIGEPAERYVEASYTLTDGPYTARNETLREDGIRGMVESLIDHESGDFSGAPVLLADAVLIIARAHGARRVERTFDLTSLPSVADYVSDLYPEGDDF